MHEINNRIKWIDDAKVVGIYLVVLGHLLYGGSSFATNINKLIYSFHVPMFFILSGYVAKLKCGPIFPYVINKAKRVLIPAILLYLLTFPLLVYRIDVKPMSIGTILSVIFYFRGLCIVNDPVWFFICIFQVYVMARIIVPIYHRKGGGFFVTVSCWILGWLINSYHYSLFDVFGFDKMIVGLFFFSVGVELRKIDYENRYNKQILLLAVVWILLALLNCKVSIYSFTLGNYLIFSVCGVIGSIAYFAFVKILGLNRFFRKLSNYSVFIISTHYVLIDWLVGQLRGYENTYIFDVISFIGAFIIIAILYPLCKLSERYVPCLIGK